jgi:hypothetical protein
MGGNSQSVPEYQFTPTIIKSNGRTVAAQYIDPFTNMLVTQIDEPQDSNDSKNKLKQQISDGFKQINTFSPDLLKQFDKIAEAKKQKSIEEYEAEYEPKYRANMEDFFSRLGTLDSTAYLDSVNALESGRRRAYSDISRDYTADIDTLKQNELQNRYAYLSYLQKALNDTTSANDNYFNSLLSASSNYNNNRNNYYLNSSKSSSSPNYVGLGTQAISLLGNVLGSL